MKNTEQEDAVAMREALLQDEIVRLDADNAEKDRIIAELRQNGSTPSVSKLKIPEETFIVEEVEYRFLVAGFHHKNKFYTAKEALGNLELLAEIVEFGIVTTV
jgi:hypothetical protein